MTTNKPKHKLLRPISEVSVKIDREDTTELFYMLRGRGGSALRRKLLEALRVLDPRAALDLEGR